MEVNVIYRLRTATQFTAHGTSWLSRNIQLQSATHSNCHPLPLGSQRWYLIKVIFSNIINLDKRPACTHHYCWVKSATHTHSILTQLHKKTLNSSAEGQRATMNLQGKVSLSFLLQVIGPQAKRCKISRLEKFYRGKKTTTTTTNQCYSSEGGSFVLQDQKMKSHHRKLRKSVLYLH